MPQTAADAIAELENARVRLTPKVENLERHVKSATSRRGYAASHPMFMVYPR